MPPSPSFLSMTQSLPPCSHPSCVVHQVIVATQMVVEEKFLGQYNVPALMAVGWEGVFGMGTMMARPKAS